MEPIKILLLADESANWRIAGLPQLERLALAINKLAESPGSQCKIDIFIFWKPTMLKEQRWGPEDARLTRCGLHLINDVHDLPDARVLSTHLLVNRFALDDLTRVAPAIDNISSWQELADVFDRACRIRPSGWRCIEQPDEIAQAERWLLRNSGKTQDGIVSRFLNRPASRAISRLLLKTSVTPGAWTLSIFALPIVTFLVLCRGNYIGFVAGAALFQIFSMLDGCDGEIARAKYLETDNGRRLDTFCDVAGNVLFALGLGFGLQRLHHGGYLVEGILCAAALAANEWLLADSKTGNDPLSDKLDQTFYHRHRAMLQRAGLLFLGEKVLWWIFQLTKRDVAIFFFFLLAIAARSEWILHLWSAVTGVSLVVAFTARLRAR